MARKSRSFDAEFFCKVVKTDTSMGAGGDRELDSLFYGLARTGLILKFGLPFNVFCVPICDLFYFS